MKSTGKPPLRWTAILFALAVNMLLVTVFRGLVQVVGMPFELNVLDTMVAPLLAGVLTAFYAPYRGGMPRCAALRFCPPHRSGRA